MLSPIAMVHAETRTIALVSSFASTANAMMTLIWGLISAEEVAPHLLLGTASPIVLFNAKAKLILLTNAHLQSHAPPKLN